MDKLTILQIAEHAGVSTATVDRILHGRTRVSEKTRKRVEEAVKELQNKNIPELFLQAAKGSYRFKFLTPNRKSNFVVDMERSLMVATAAFNDVEIICDLHQISLSDGNDLIEALDGIDPDQHQGVGAFVIDAPGVKQAISRAVERGINVITLVSDIPDSSRHHFVGIDNVSAGRVVGNLMGRFIGAQDGKIGVITGSLRIRDQFDRFFGFRQVIEERFPRLQLLPVFECESDPEKNRATTSELLQNEPQLQGLYSIAAGNIGILDALDNTDQSPVVIMHELSDPVRKALAKAQVDAVISQNTDHIARSAMRVLRAYCEDKPIVESQERIRMDIFLADNIY